MDEDTVKVFLPDPEDCYQRLRRARFGATVSCVYCDESEPVIKKGTTGKGAQQYRCKECETYFNDLTGTIFEHRKFPIEEITLSEVCEADEIYVTAGEKGIEKEDEEGRDRGLKKRTGKLRVIVITASLYRRGDSCRRSERLNRRFSTPSVELFAVITIRQAAGRDARPSLRRTSSVSGAEGISKTWMKRSQNWETAR